MTGVSHGTGKYDRSYTASTTIGSTTAFQSTPSPARPEVDSGRQSMGTSPFGTTLNARPPLSIAVLVDWELHVVMQYQAWTNIMQRRDHAIRTCCTTSDLATRGWAYSVSNTAGSSSAVSIVLVCVPAIRPWCLASERTTCCIPGSSELTNDQLVSECQEEHQIVVPYCIHAHSVV
jgi:hypothetical protein